MTTLSGPFRIDRLEVPQFYTVVSAAEAALVGAVVAQTNYHTSDGWITVGFVSAQTPLGQGIYMGFEQDQLREATPAEVIAALKRNHPHGQRFRPGCTEVQNASFHLIMAGAIGNWTNDSYRADAPPLHDVSRSELETLLSRAEKAHHRLMLRWRRITGRQIRVILKELSRPAPAT